MYDDINRMERYTYPIPKFKTAIRVDELTEIIKTSGRTEGVPSGIQTGYV
jgi:hypothetical protein